MTKGEVNTTIGVLYDMAVMLVMKSEQKTTWSEEWRELIEASNSFRHCAEALCEMLYKEEQKWNSSEN